MSNPYKKILFPVHIYQCNIRENQIIQDEIVPVIEDIHQKKKSLIPDGWETTKLHTSFDIAEINQPLFSEQSAACRYYIKYVSKFFDKPSQLEIVDIWYNYYDDGEYQEIHDHLNSNIFLKKAHFSCIHYLKYDSNVHVPTTFIDPIEQVRTHSLEMESNHYGPKYHPHVREGDLIMFPSYLQHFVQKSDPTPDSPRITVAFNLHVSQYGDYFQDGS